MRLFEIFIQVIATGLMLVLAFAMVRRRLLREYPWFFGYIVFILVRTAVLALLYNDYKAYFYGYWLTEAFTAILALLALHEAFYEVFYGFYLFWWFRLIFPAVLAVIAFFCIRESLLKPIVRLPVWMLLVMSVDNTTSYAKAAVFLVFMFLVIALHVRWRRYPYDIVLGLAVTSVGMFAFYGMWAKGGLYTRIGVWAPPITFIVALGIWLWSFAGKFESEPRPEWKYDVTPEQLLQQVKEYIRIMKKGSGEAQ